MVVLDKHAYINKAQDLLAGKDTYRPITGDPATKQKKCIQILRTIKAHVELSDNTYKKDFIPQVQSPLILWTPDS